MDKDLNVWDVIDTYFRDTPKYKSLHQLDSFNEFIFSEINGIKYIIKRENPLIIYKEALNANATSYKYEIHIWDDASIDNTSNICLEFAKQYPEKINLVVQDVNTFCQSYEQIQSLAAIRKEDTKYFSRRGYTA